MVAKHGLIGLTKVILSKQSIMLAANKWSNMRLVCCYENILDGKTTILNNY